MASKAELVRFLDERVFTPILKHGTDHTYNAALNDAQSRTRAEQQRYYSYASAEEVVRMYKDDLHSKAADKVNAELRRLDLPVLADVKDEFLKLAGE